MPAGLQCGSKLSGEEEAPIVALVKNFRKLQMFIAVCDTTVGASHTAEY